MVIMERVFMEDLTKRKIGQRINDALACSDTKQKDLAKYLGVTDNTVSYFVSGKRSPNIEQIIKISELLNVSTDFLLGKSTPKTPIDTEKGRLIRSICEHTGLEEDAVDFLAESKDDCLSDIYNDFLNFFIANTNEELTLSLINLRELSTVHNLLLSEFHYMVAEKFNSVTLGEAIKEVESSELFGKVVHLNEKIEDLQVNIDGQKFKINKIFNKLIDEFALSNIEASSECDIHTSNTSIIYAIEDIHKSFLELKKYAVKSSAAEGAEDNGNHKKEE